MTRAMAFLLVPLLLLAGCSGSDDESAAGPTGATASPTSPTDTTDAPPPPLVTTSVLHLRKTPTVELVAPTGSDPEQSPMPYGQGGFGTMGSGAKWDYKMQGDGKLGSLEASVKIRVIDQLVVQPSQNPTPCVWSLTVSVDGTTAYPVMCSGPSGPTIAPGDYELRFSAEPTEAGKAGGGKTITFAVQRLAFSPSPNDSVFVLTGTPDLDSTVTISGLAEPVPTA